MFVLDRWRQERRLRRVARRMLAARRAGLGLYLREWRLEREALIADAIGVIDAAAEAILTWCRQTIAECRRPWGIDHFDLTLACSEGGAVRTLQLRELRPIQLYSAATFFEQIAAFLRQRQPSTASAASPVQIAGALFSWGDAADKALAAS